MSKLEDLTAAPPSAPILASGLSGGGSSGSDQGPGHLGTSAETTGGASPPSPPPPAPHYQARAAAIKREYVAGGGWTYLSTYARSLPQWIDDSTRDFGDDLYEQMLLDPQCNSSIRVLKLQTLCNGVRLDPAVEAEGYVDPYETEDVVADGQQRDSQGRYYPKKHKKGKDGDEEAEAERDKRMLARDADLAADINDFCHDNLAQMDGRGFVDVLYEMLDCLGLGNRVAEQIYEVRDLGWKRGPMLCLKALKVKPRRSYSFVVDPFLNVIGLQALIPGTAYPVTTGQIISEPAKMTNLLPREKFAVLTWAGPAGDPRGSSLLRTVYNPWWLKRQTWGEYAKYLSQFAGPSLVGTTAQGAQPVPPTDALGNIIPGAPLITPEQAMLNALLAFKNGTAVAFPFGSVVTPINMQGEGVAFKSAIELFDQQIAKGILCQTLATEEGQHQARAAASTHQDVLDMVVLHIKAVVAQMIRWDILYPLVRYNWGEKIARRLTPKVHLAEIERHNWAQDAAAIASLVSSQFLDRSQYPEMDARLGLPKRKSNAPPQGAPGQMPPGQPGKPPMGAPMPGGGGAPPGGNQQAAFLLDDAEPRRGRLSTNVAAFNVSGGGRRRRPLAMSRKFYDMVMAG